MTMLYEIIPLSMEIWKYLSRTNKLMVDALSTKDCYQSHVKIIVGLYCSSYFFSSFSSFKKELFAITEILLNAKRESTMML